MVKRPAGRRLLLCAAVAALVSLSPAWLAVASPSEGPTGSAGPQPLSIEPQALSVRYTYRTMDGLETKVVSPLPAYDHLHDVAWAPDGHMALAVGSHNILLGWDRVNQTGRALRNGTLGNLYGVAWSADSTTALAVGWNGSLVRYTVSGIEDLPSQGSGVWEGATWFPGKGFLVVGEAGSAFFLDGDVRTNVTTPTANELMAVAYNPVSGLALAVGQGGVAVEIDAAGSASLVASPTAEDLRAVGFETDTGVGHVAGGVDVLLTFSAGTLSNESHPPQDGGFYDLTVTNSTAPSVVALRNLTTSAGSLLFTNGTFNNLVPFGPTLAGVEAVARSPTDGYVLATGFFGIVMMAWDNGTWSYATEVGRSSILDVAWRPAGDLALLVGLNGTARLYNRTADTSTFIAVPSYNVSLRGVSWAPNGSQALIVGANAMWMYDVASGNITLPAGNQTVDFYAVAFRPQGTDALLVGTGGFIGRWDGNTLTRVSGAVAQSFYSVAWHLDGTGTGDYAYAGGSNIVARYDLAGGVTTTTRLGTFFGVAFLGDDVWIAGDPHQIHRYEAATGIWDNITLPSELSLVHLARLRAAPSGEGLLIVGNQSFSAFVNGTDLRRFDTGFLSSYNAVDYNPVTGDALFGGVIGLGFAMKMGTFPNLAPVVALSSPANNSNWTTANTISFDASASFDPDGDALSFSWYDNLTGYLTSAASFAAPLGAGNHTVTVTVGDGHGHNASAAVHLVIAEAQYPPVALVASPAGNASYTDDDNITFSAAGSYDPNLNDSLSFEWSSSLSGLIGSTPIVVAKLSAGAHTVTLRVTDSTGRSTNATLLLVVAQGDLAPLISVASPRPGILYAANVPIVFDARNSTDPDSASFTLVWYVDAAVAGQGLLFNQTLPQGSHTLRVVADDGRKTSELSFDIAVGPPVNVRPKILSFFPGNGSTLTGEVIFVGSVEADPWGPVLYVELRFGDGDWLRAAGNSSWSLNVDTRLLANGPINATLRAVDYQYTAQVALVFVVDNPFVNTPPTLSVLTPRPGATLRGLVTIAGATDDPDNQTLAVEYRWRAGPWSNATIEATSWTASVDTAGLPNGPVTLEVRAFDGFNYSDVSAVTVVIDNPAPGFLPGPGALFAAVALAGAACLALKRRQRL